MSEFAVDVLGCRFEFRGDATELLGLLARLLDASRCPVVDVDHVITVSRRDGHFSFQVNDYPGGEVARDRSVTWALWLISQLSQEVVRSTFVVHGACLMVGETPTLIIGRSGAGKSTLTAALLATGAHVLSDELTELTADARLVDGFRRAVMLEDDAPGVLEEAGLLGSLNVLPLSEFDGAAALVPVEQRVTHFATERRPVVLVLGERTDPFSVRRLRAAEVAVRLIEHSVGLHSEGRMPLAVIASIARRCDGVHLSGGTLTERVNVARNAHEW